MMTFFRWPWPLIGAFLFAACGAEVADHSEDPLLLSAGATRDTSGRSIYRLERPLGDSRYEICTFTLITPNVVLTAAHCVVNGAWHSITVPQGSSAIRADSCMVHPRAFQTWTDGRAH